MKNIKLRVWDKGLEEMIYFTINDVNDTVDILIYKDKMFCINLKDKNKKEIYEKDIFRDTEANRKGIIKYIKEGGSFCAQHCWEKGQKEQIRLTKGLAESIEIICDKYNILELMEVNNE
jgi:hypothetical protein